jgi:acyl-CoA dehydrogenase
VLDDSHVAFRDSVRAMARQHVTPIADEMDRTNEYPMQILDLFRRQGLVQLAVPERFGGPGGDVTSICIAREEVARAGSMALATLAGQNNTLTLALLQIGTEEQRERFMPRLAEGAVALVALTEADAGSDTARMTTRARRDGDHWILTGQKSYISWGKLATFAVVFARTNDTPGGRGLSGFIVEVDDPRFVIARENDKMGQRGFPNVEVVLDELRVPDSNMLGAEGAGLSAALQGLHQNRTMMAAIALGGGLAALDYATGFLQNRGYKGRPMTELQGLRWMLADMAIDLEASRALIYECAARLDAGVPVSEIVQLSSTAKLFATETAVKVCGDAIQLLGGAGYMKDHPVERFLRDARTTTIYEGTTQVQKNTIAKALLGGA